MRWWMSFSDVSRPPGERNLGCVIVHAEDMIEATQIAWIRGINPGGAILFMKLEDAQAKRLSFSLEPYEWRLLTVTEARELAARINAELTS